MSSGRRWSCFQAFDLWVSGFIIRSNQWLKGYKSLCKSLLHYMNALSSPLGARQSLRLKTAATDLDQKQDQDQMSAVNVLQTICSGCLNERSGQFPARTSRFKRNLGIISCWKQSWMFLTKTWYFKTNRDHFRTLIRCFFVPEHNQNQNTSSALSYRQSLNLLLVFAEMFFANTCSKLHVSKSVKEELWSFC